MLGIVLSILLICWTNLSLVALAGNAPSASPAIFTWHPTFPPVPTVEPTSQPTFQDPGVLIGEVLGGFFGGTLGFVGLTVCTLLCVLYRTKAGARFRLRALERRELKLNVKIRRLEEQINSGRSSFFSSAQARELKYNGFLNQRKWIQADIREITRRFFPEDSRAAETPNARTPPSFALASAVQARESVPYANVVTTGDLDLPTAAVAYPKI